MVSVQGYTASNYLAIRNFKKDASPILAVSLHLPGLWLGVALSGLFVLLEAHYAWGKTALEFLEMAPQPCYILLLMRFDVQVFR